jgi:hypothetical protein
MVKARSNRARNESSVPPQHHARARAATRGPAARRQHESDADGPVMTVMWVAQTMALMLVPTLKYSVVSKMITMMIDSRQVLILIMMMMICLLRHP